MEIARAEPDRCAVIDAIGDEETVHSRIMQELRKRLKYLDGDNGTRIIRLKTLTKMTTHESLVGTQTF